MSLRTLRYRRLALAACDTDTARLLLQLADEADRGVLVTVEWTPNQPPAPQPIVIEGVAYRTHTPVDWTV